MRCGKRIDSLREGRRNVRRHLLQCFVVCGMCLSIYAIETADTMNAMWIMVCHCMTWTVRLGALMKVFSRWIDEMPMIAVASLTLSTFALTCDSHSGSSGWPSRLSRDTKVS